MRRIKYYLEIMGNDEYGWFICTKYRHLYLYLFHDFTVHEFWRISNNNDDIYYKTYQDAKTQLENYYKQFDFILEKDFMV